MLNFSLGEHHRILYAVPLAIEFLLMIYTARSAWQLRRLETIDHIFNEARFIAIALWNTALGFVLAGVFWTLPLNINRLKVAWMAMFLFVNVALVEECTWRNRKQS